MLGVLHAGFGSRFRVSGLEFRDSRLRSGFQILNLCASLGFQSS